MNRLIVSVDVEDWYHGPSVHPAMVQIRSIGSLPISGENFERAYKYVDLCLEILDKYKIKATFFWVGEFAQRFSSLLKKTAHEGHEIACHGLSHYCKYDHKAKAEIFAKGDFIQRTLKARGILEDISGKSVIGYRAPNAYISGKMIDYLEEMGFKYDSSVSVNSLYNKTDSSLLNVTTSPYYPEPGSLNRGDKRRDIIEFPWPFYTFFGYKMQCAGGPFLRIFGSTLIRKGLRQSLKRDHTIFYFHPIDICNEDIPLPFSMKRPFLWFFKGNLVKRRIEKVLKEFSPISTNFENVLEDIY